MVNVKLNLTEAHIIVILGCEEAKKAEDLHSQVLNHGFVGLKSYKGKSEFYSLLSKRPHLFAFEGYKITDGETLVSTKIDIEKYDQSLAPGSLRILEGYMKQALKTPKNSKRCQRFKNAGNQEILFNAEFIYKKLNIDEKLQKIMKKTIEEAQNLVWSDGHCDLKSNLSLPIDHILRCILDEVCAYTSNQDIKVRDTHLYSRLPQNIRTYLKSRRGLSFFCHFFPDVFSIESYLHVDVYCPSYGVFFYEIGIAEKPQNIKLLSYKNSWKYGSNLAFDRISRMLVNYLGKDQKVDVLDPDNFDKYNEDIKQILEKASFNNFNSNVILHENLETPMFKIDWILSQLEYEDVKLYLSSLDYHLKEDFYIMDPCIAIPENLMDTPSDKSVSLAILKILKEEENNISSYEELLSKLPEFCAPRIRNVQDLQGFFSLYPDFHHDNNLIQRDSANFKEAFPIEIIDEFDQVLEI